MTVVSNARNGAFDLKIYLCIRRICKMLGNVIATKIVSLLSTSNKVNVEIPIVSNENRWNRKWKHYAKANQIRQRTTNKTTTTENEYLSIGNSQYQMVFRLRIWVNNSTNAIIARTYYISILNYAIDSMNYWKGKKRFISQIKRRITQHFLFGSLFQLHFGNSQGFERSALMFTCIKAICSTFSFQLNSSWKLNVKNCTLKIMKPNKCNENTMKWKWE